MSTGRIAFVRGVIAASIRFAIHLPRLRIDIDEYRLGPPSNMMLLLEAMNENGVVMTSSPGPMPSACQHRCRPAVPLLHEIACFTPNRR